MKPTSVFHNATESEIISLDTGLRLDGLPVFYVPGCVSRVSDRSGTPEIGEDKHHKSHNKIDVMQNIDVVFSNVQSANREAWMYVFGLNVAVLLWDTFPEPIEVHLIGCSY